MDLRLHRLTGLEHEKLLQEYADKIAEIADYLEILSDPDRLKQVIRESLKNSSKSSVMIAKHRFPIRPMT